MRLEDYDDEEEFLVAGGNVEQARTRKEWGLAMRVEPEEEIVGDVDSKEDRSKKAQEEKRKMYRESEKLMRERRCMIKPAPVQKRCFKALQAKVEARVAQVVEPVHRASGQEDQDTSAPQAPKAAEAAAAPGKMVTMDEEDDDDEIIIRGNTVPSTPLQLPRISNASAAARSSAETTPPPAGGKSAEAYEDKEKIRTPKKSVFVANKPPIHILSPPKARKKRAEMLNQLHRTAQSRSEHLITAERAGIKVKREAPTGFSKEMDLEAQPDPFPNLKIAFIASAKYVGSKRGYVFHMSDRGLGYYKETAHDEEGGGEDFFDGVSKMKLAGNDSGRIGVLKCSSCFVFDAAVACEDSEVFTSAQGWKIRTTSHGIPPGMRRLQHICAVTTR